MVNIGHVRANIYSFKVTIETLEKGVFIVNVEYISHVFLVFLL